MKRHRLKNLKLLPFLLMLSLTGCSLTRNGEGKKKEPETTEEPLITASGTSAYYDINENVKDVATYTEAEEESEDTTEEYEITTEYTDINDYFSDIPEYSGEVSVIVNNDIPFFTDDQLTTECYTDYGSLDPLGRTQSSIAVVYADNLPEGERGEIGHIKPTGWVQNKYEGIVDSDPPYLYNRCHLVMWAMIGDESNVQENLITGTRYFNTSGMLPNETEVLNYIKTSGNHVIYRVTPYYNGDNLLANGVLMEAKSVEDDGASLSLCRWVYNIQPGIEIDYSTGDNRSLE